MLLVEEVGEEHHQAGERGHAQQQTEGLPVLHAAEQGLDARELLRVADAPGRGGVFEGGDLVGVLGHAADQVGRGGNDHSEGGGQLREEGPQGGHDALVAGAVLELVVLDGVHDGDHHDEVKAVLAEVCQHVAQGAQHELQIYAAHGHAAGADEQARAQHDRIADKGDEHEFVHQRFAVDLPGDGGVEYHQQRRDRHAHGVEQGVEAALVAKLKVDVGGAHAGEHDTVADLLDEEDQRDPQQLVVAADGAEDLLEADGRDGVVVVVALLLDAEDREGQKGRAQDRDDQGHAPVSGDGVAADGGAAGGEHGDQRARKGAADAGKERGAGGVLVAGVGVGAQGRDHAPVGDVVHGVGDAVEEVDDAEEPHEAPALEARVEGQIDHDRGGEDADDQPGLELAPAGARALDDVAHDGVVQRVEHTGGDHDGRDGGELSGGKLVGEEDKGVEVAGDQVVHHVAPHGAQGEHDEVFLLRGLFVHVGSSYSGDIFILPLRRADCKKFQQCCGELL